MERGESSFKELMAQSKLEQRSSDFRPGYFSASTSSLRRGFSEINGK